MLKLTSPASGTTVSRLTPVQREFLQRDRSGLRADAVDWQDLTQCAEERSYPAPVEFTWEPPVEGTLLLFEGADRSAPQAFPGVGSCCVFNLKADTAYCARVKKEEETSAEILFRTAKEPRLLFVEGITNVRDCGGWSAAGGRRYRQGLLYRGSEMNSHVTVTEEGLRTLREDLKLKTVLDIRGGWEEVQDPCGVGYYNIPTRPYGEWLDHPEQFAELLPVLADKANYPLYFHCWGGADRTGTIAFFVGALLGMSLEDLITDYELTTLSIWGVRSRNTENFANFLLRFQALEGETVQEKAETFARAAGITEEQLAELRENLLE